MEKDYYCMTTDNQETVDFFIPNNLSHDDLLEIEEWLALIMRHRKRWVLTNNG